MVHLLFLGILAGLDNLQVAAAIGFAPLSRARRRLLLAAFVAFEVAAPFVGLLAARQVHARFGYALEAVEPLVILACGIVIVGLALRGGDSALRLIGSRWMLIGLPAALSLDNLLIGATSSSAAVAGPSAALSIGVVSASMGAVGLLAGGRLSRLIPGRAVLVAGCALIVIAGAMSIRL